MKKIICKREYDTETATLVKKAHRGGIRRSAGYEETLYQTPGGLYFLYFRGGPASAYAKEDIKCLAKGKVDAWVESPLSVQYAVRKPPEAGMVPPSGAFRLFGPLPWGKETLLMHDDTSKTQILTSPVTGRAAGLGRDAGYVLCFRPDGLWGSAVPSGGAAAGSL